MVRITKLTDYAVVILAFIASDPNRLFQAKEISNHTSINLPTVSKLLKMLAKNNFLLSLRGKDGGYRLKQDADQLSLMDVIEALEGPFAITECNLGHDHCNTETQCTMRTPWLHINNIISATLAAIKLSDLKNPLYTPKQTHIASVKKQLQPKPLQPIESRIKLI